MRTLLLNTTDYHELELGPEYPFPDTFSELKVFTKPSYSKNLNSEKFLK